MPAIPQGLQRGDLPDVDVRDPQFAGGAQGGGADDTAAFAAAITYLRSLPRGGSLRVPHGDFWVSALDLSAFGDDFVHSLHIIGSGMHSTRILGTGSGKVVVDAIGANNLEISELTIGTHGVVAQAGLLLARSVASANCNGGRFTNVSIEGQFSVACLVSIASEGNIWVGPRFANLEASASHRCLYTSSQNIIGITSDYGVPQTSSNTQNSMYGPTFYAPYDDAEVCVFQRQADYAFFNPLVITGEGDNGKLAVYKTATGLDVFNGPVTWYSPLFEGKEPIIHYFDCAVTGANYFKSVSHYGGYVNRYPGGTNITRFIEGNETGGKLVILMDSTFKPEKVNDSVVTQATLYAFDNCTLDLRRTNANSSIIPTGYQIGSTLLASDVVELQSGDGYRESFGTAIPTTGTYRIGHFRHNTDQASFWFSGLVGWHCVDAGTPGTWKERHIWDRNGATVSRPAAGGTTPAGMMYVDTTLGRPVWHIGGVWVDATGTAV